MKLKKVLSILIISILSVFVLNTIKVNAETGSLELGLEEYRSSGYGYQAIEKIMWKISSYNSSGVANTNRTIYCLKGGPGFGSEQMGNTILKREYTQYFDLKNLSSIPSPYRDVLPSGKNYNSLVWVLDNCYVPSQNSDTSSSEYIKAQAYRAKLLKNAGVTSAISDDEIDIAQQFAVWYFTNNDEYKLTDKSFSLYVKSKTGGSYQAIGDAFDDGIYRNMDAVRIFNYLISKGEENKDTVPTVSTENTISLTSNTAAVVQTATNYIIGPYKLNKTGNVNFELIGTLKTSSGSNISYTLLDSNKNETTKTLAELVGENFYLSVPVTEQINNAEFTISVTEYNTNITFWSVAGAITTLDQPVAEITRDSNNYDLKAQISANFKFDLALRKFISAINGNELLNSDGTYQREPKYDVTPLKDGDNSTTTAIYKHEKNPVKIAVGDIVTYTIRVYNEGEIDGYASKITDYLPPELELVENDTLNTTYGWEKDSTGRKISTTYLAKTDARNNLLLAYDGGDTLSYKDVQINCRVKNNITQGNQITNIAEITQMANISGTAVSDIDSSVNNVSIPEDVELPNYKGNTNNKSDLTDRNYHYKGQQDDDDFEKLITEKFDLALRKFITAVNTTELKETNGKYVREPNISLAPLTDGDESTTTAEYRHQKEPVGVRKGDIVTYTLRIYNEGEIDGYASLVTDYLPPQLEFINNEFNASYGWRLVDDSLRKVSTDFLKMNADDPEENLIKAFDGTTLDYKELKIQCKVKQTVGLGDVITNIAEITDATNKNGIQVSDIDSNPSNVVLPEDINLPEYKGNSSNKSILTDKNYHYKGQEDDDDFEKLIIEEFDLALRKFITKIENEIITSRIPKFTLNKDKNGNYIYEHSKVPLKVQTTDLVEYTIRIYNEGNIAGYAKQIKDNIPYGLEFLPNNETNILYRWIMLDEEGNETDDITKAKSIVTDYLSKEQEVVDDANLLIPFDKENMESPDYRDVKVVFKVVAPSTYEGVLTNIAEISDDSDENGNKIDDRDSTPNNDNEDEDDIDKEHVVLEYFDLALRKFITAVDDKEITNRYPVFSINENGKYVYNHTKEPVDVENGNIVTYTIRVYNEGLMDGYAKEVKDDIPDGLEYLPENDLNKEYRWVMLDEEGNKTDDITKAVSISTDYLSKGQEKTENENLLKSFDKVTMTEPAYKEVKIAFKVVEPNTSDRIIVNKAQISNDSDKEDNNITDIDSIPDKWNEGEDDQDIEKIKVKYFDLALRKWVTQAIVIEDGKEVVTETGHKAEDDPEEIVKVEIVESKLKKVVVKFKYKIRVTNEGEIPGYVKEISDYIPEGLKFEQADNPKWKEVEGKIVTDELKDTLLNPGESAEVEVVLTWINGKDNLNLKVNVAEISKDKNNSDTPDIDSTPNNKEEGEDDIDDAPVILTIKTGAEINNQIIIISGVMLAILSTGLILIKKYII